MDISVSSAEHLKTILNTCRVKEYRNLYVVGTHDVKKTIATQQLRASVLSYSLYRNISDVRNIAVVGAGFAGVSAASTLLILGYKVTLFEKSNHVIPVQRKCVDRYIHPYLYDWPDNIEDEEYAIGGLCWQAGYADEVRRSVEEQFRSIRSDYSDKFDIKMGVNIVDIVQEGDGTSTLKDYHVNWYQGFDAVFLCVGFGFEKQEIYDSTEVGYWGNPIAVNKYGSRDNPCSILISGNGDGGLISVITYTLSDFMPENIVEYVRLLVDEAVEIKLREIESKIRGDSNLRISQLYDLALSDNIDMWRSQLEEHVCDDTKVEFNSKSEGVFSVNSSALNRFLVYVLWRCGYVSYRHSEFTNDLIEMNVVDTRRVYAIEWEKHLDRVLYDRVETWHGVDPDYFDKAFPKLADKVKHMKERNKQVELERSIPDDVLRIVKGMQVDDLDI